MPPGAAWPVLSMSVGDMTRGPVTAFPALRDAFLRDIATEGAAARTVAAYRADLDDTARTLSADAGLRTLDALDVAAVSSADLRAAVAAYRERPDPRYSAHPDRAPVIRARATVARRIAVGMSLAVITS